MGTRHIITGGSGFIGRYLVQALSDRHEETVIFDLTVPAAPLPEAVEYSRGDIRVASDLARLQLGPDDVVYHLAARQFHAGVPRTGRDAWFAEVNTAGTSLLLDAMARGGAGRLVFFSTDMVYGVPERTPVQPDHPRRPLGPYGRSKAAAEEIMARHRQDGMKITVFRPRLVTGAGRYGILLKLFRLIEAGLPVPMIGAGDNRYQMVSVHDCVDAALRAVDLGLPAGPFNLGSAAPPTVRALLEFMIQRAGSGSRPIPTPAGLTKAVCAALDRMGLTVLYPEQYQIADLNYIVDTSRTTEVLSWMPRYSDYDMMAAAYEDYLRQRREKRPPR
ncbi:MAG: NAD(P)-dependent oxidoreductase [Dongiaceae bacterium]